MIISKLIVFIKEHGVKVRFRAIENNVAFIILFLLALLPVIEVIARVFKTGMPSSSDYLQHLVIWITFIGGMITSREKRHLALTIGIDHMPGKVKDVFLAINTGLSAFIITLIAWSSLSMVFVAFDIDRAVGVLPIKFVTIIMPLGYAVIAMRFISGAEKKSSKIAGLSGLVMASIASMQSIANFAMSLGFSYAETFDQIAMTIYGPLSLISIPIIIMLVVSAFLGMPIFVVLGGIGYMFFVRSGGSLEVISNEAYTMLTSHSIPAIPLFTMAGFILSESKSGERLVNLFRAWFGWMPGGMGIMAVMVCAFFTTFTGASGVTILALGGLLSFILINSGRYSEKFTYGLLTASGSIGLLFPPSLPIILYGVVAQISIKDMFIGGLLPGISMVLILSLYCVIVAQKSHVERVPFKLKEALLTMKESIWELLLPVLILLGVFGGYTTIVETGGVAVVYSLFISMVVHKDITMRGLPDVLLKCLPVIGGVLIILALSRGLSYYIVDAEIPMALTAWVQVHIQSKIVFLIILNVALLITGCLMDIFSAIMVVVPLIIPLGKLFGIDPVHLGIIFLANLELGYLTPPVGLNLFLASYRFEQKLSQVYRNVVPFFLVLLITVILITYVPWLSTGLLTIIGQ